MNMLLENGYNDINFMNDIPLDDLKGIGVASHQDRERVSNYNNLFKLHVQQESSSGSLVSDAESVT